MTSNKNVAVETQFKNWLIENYPKLNKNKINRKGNGERRPHLRFYKDCGLQSFNDFLDFFKSFPLVPNDNYTGSPDYKGQGFDIKWNNNSIGILFGVAKEGNIERKKYTPKALGLNGSKFSDAKIFRQNIINSLQNVESDQKILDCLISMLDNIDGRGPVINHPFLKQNTNKITSDFGEVLAAYKSCLSGKQITFPDNSNNNIADYYVNGKAYSAKGRKAGGKVNLVDYKSLISLDSDVGNFLYSLADHDKNNFFKYAAILCKEANELASWVNGTDEDSVKKYVSNTSYDEFYDQVTQRFGGLGVPLASKDERPRQLWAQGDTNPFYFTLNTIFHRFWGVKNSDQITKVVSSFLNAAIFVHIDIQNLNIDIREVPFKNIDKWQTAYWSRATKAWHNWMAVEPCKEQQ
jgi:hypothetical protein